MPRRRKQEKNKSRGTKLKKHPKTGIIVIFLVVVFSSLIITEITYLLYNIRYVKVLTAKLEVSGNVAFALGGENLNVINFGAVVPGGRSRRFITAENLENFDISASIIATGNMRGFLSYENNFIIKPNETKRIDFEVYAPLDTAKGRYAGRIFLVFKRA